MKQIAAIASITFKEGIRDRALYGIFIFSLVVMVTGLVLLSFFMRNLGKVASDFMLSAIAFAGLLLCFFLSSQLLSKDMDKKTIHIVLSKPIKRSQYILGKYLGLLSIQTAATGILSSIALLFLLFSKNQYPLYFKDFQFSVFCIAIWGEWLAFSLINAFILLFASFTSSGFLNILFSISIYVIGETTEEVYRYLQTTTEELIMGTSVRWMISVSRYLIPNFSVFDLKQQAAHGVAVSSGYVLSMSAYALVYIAALLLISTIIFQKRELI